MKSYSDRRNQKGIEINFTAFFRELSKKVLSIILVTAIGAAIGGIVAKVTFDDTYTSTVSFVVNTSTETDKAASNEISAQINMAGTFNHILSSRKLKTAVYEKCSKKISYGTINGSISTRIVSSTNVITMSVRTGDAKISFEIASAVVEVYGDIVEETYPNAMLTLCDEPVLAQQPDKGVSTVSFAAIIAFACAVVYCVVLFVMFIVKDTVKTADEIDDKLNAHLLGSVQHVANLDKTAKGLLVTDRKTGFTFIETYKAIRTKIENNSLRTGNKVFLVTSACENEGKTTSCVNIALSLAQNGKSVLVIDADLRKPSVSKLLSLRNLGGGLADVLTKRAPLEQAIKFINNFNLYVLAGEEAVSNPSELLSTDVMEKVIESVRQQFDYVLIDTAPASVVTDAAVIASFSDAAIIVIREDSSPYSLVRLAIDDIDSNGAEIVGCIFNADTSGNGNGFGYGRYGRHKYGKYGYGRYGYGRYGYGKYGYGSYGYGYGQTSAKSESKSKNKNKK